MEVVRELRRNAPKLPVGSDHRPVSGVPVQLPATRYQKLGRNRGDQGDTVYVFEAKMEIPD